jgi:quinol monooxygenase YgiN
MLIVRGSVIARPDSFDDLLQLSLEHVLRSRAEPGCISHEVSVDAENPLRLVFFERWADEAALKAHFAVPASRAMWKRLHELAADPQGMQVYSTSETKVG